MGNDYFKYEVDSVRNGGQRRIRTADAGLFRAALYQLSYLASGEKVR
jgi:hypothetical protein